MRKTGGMWRYGIYLEVRIDPIGVLQETTGWIRVLRRQTSCEPISSSFYFIEYS